MLQQAISTLKENGFIISRESIALNLDSFSKTLDIISSVNVGTEKLVLLRKKASSKPARFIKVNDSDDKFAWLENLKTVLKETDKLVLIAQKQPLNGILGLVNCLRREPGGETVGCIDIMDNKAPDFNPDIEFYEEQLDKDLAVNVFKDVSNLFF